MKRIVSADATHGGRPWPSRLVLIQRAMVDTQRLPISASPGTPATRSDLPRAAMGPVQAVNISADRGAGPDYMANKTS